MCYVQRIIQKIDDIYYFYKMLFLKYIVVLIFSCGIIGKKIPKKIWMYWENGYQNGYEFVKLAVENTKTYAKIDGWQVHPLDKNSIAQFLTQQQIPPRISTSFFSEVQHFADSLRLALLQKYGGVWMDASIITLQSFQWLHKLNQDLNVLNKYGQEPQVFMFFLDILGSSKIVKNNLNEDVYISPGFENWFIAAVQNATLIRQWRQQFQMYHQKGNSYIKQIVNDPDFQYGELKDSYGYLAQHVAIQTVIQRKQHQLDNSPNNEIKYAVNYYRMWCANATSGPYRIILSIGFHYYPNVQILMRESIESINKTFGFPRYFIKTVNPQYRIVNGIIDPKYSYFKKMKQFFISGAALLSLSDYLWCPSSFKIMKYSIIDTYILKGNATYKPAQISNAHEVCYPSFEGLLVAFLLSILFLKLFGFLLNKTKIFVLKYVKIPKKENIRDELIEEQDYTPANPQKIEPIAVDH